jgi:hypothetical protein
MLENGRRREGLRVWRAAWLLGLTVRECRALEAGEDSLLVGQAWERTVEVFP